MFRVRDNKPRPSPRGKKERAVECHECGGKGYLDTRFGTREGEKCPTCDGMGKLKVD